MISSKAVGSVTLIIIAVAGSRIFAAEKTAAELYGQGVHAYFAHDYDSAIALLSASIKKNSSDPRAYYFRGLAHASQQGTDAGLADFAKGADLETNPTDERLYGVNSALQRIQGSLRLTLEQQRTAARLAAAERKKKQDRIKYEQLKRREDVVLYKPNQPIKSIDLKLPPVDLGGQDPFATGAAFSGGKQVGTVAPAVVEPSADAMESPAESEGEKPRDPFSDPGAKPAAPKKSDNPFGDMTPAEEPPKAEKAPDTSNPFGDDMSKAAADDPVFDDSVKPELPPGMNIGGSIMDMLGKTLSGKSAESKNRDPFADDEPAIPPKTETPADDAGTKPADDAASKPANDAGAKAGKKPEKKADPDDDPFK